jgi:hypothetical protein
MPADIFRREDLPLTVGTVMERTRTPLSIWFWGAYLAASLTPGIVCVGVNRISMNQTITVQP